RPDRGLSHGKRGDVRRLPRPDRRLRPGVPARLSLLAASRNAGGAHAPGAARADQGARRAPAPQGGRRAGCASAQPGWQRRLADGGAGVGRAHAGVRGQADRCRGRAGRAVLRPRHRIHPDALAGPAPGAHVCAVSDKPEKSRGLWGRFRRAPDAVPAAPPATGEVAVGDATRAVDPAAASDAAPAAAKAGWFQRLKAGLTKTSARLPQDIGGIFTRRKLDADTLQELEDLLIGADLGVETAMRITEALAKGRFNKEIATSEVRAVLAAEVERVLAPVAKPLTLKAGMHPH